MSKLHYLPKDPLNPWQMKCGYWLEKGVEYTTNVQIFKLLQHHGAKHLCANCLKKIIKEES